MRLAESEGQIAALREELERVSRELKAATGRERGLIAELSKLRREVRKKDTEIVSHKMYFRIISDARSAGVERHYFHTLSASSSAKHLVLTMTRE